LLEQFNHLRLYIHCIHRCARAHALRDAPRPGSPRKYETNVEAEITALSCSAPPAGAKRWTLVLLEQQVRQRPGMQELSRETIRRLLKKTASSPGAN
jgi:hypothetical protein